MGTPRDHDENLRIHVEWGDQKVFFFFGLYKQISSSSSSHRMSLITYNEIILIYYKSRHRKFFFFWFLQSYSRSKKRFKFSFSLPTCRQTKITMETLVSAKHKFLMPHIHEYCGYFYKYIRRKKNRKYFVILCDGNSHDVYIPFIVTLHLFFQMMFHLC